MIVKINMFEGRLDSLANRLDYYRTTEDALNDYNRLIDRENLIIKMYWEMHDRIDSLYRRIDSLQKYISLHCSPLHSNKTNSDRIVKITGYIDDYAYDVSHYWTMITTEYRSGEEGALCFFLVKGVWIKLRNYKEGSDFWTAREKSVNKLLFSATIDKSVSYTETVQGPKHSDPIDIVYYKLKNNP